MPKTETLESLIRTWQTRGRKPGQPLRTMLELAKTTGVTRQYLYALMRGSRAPSLPMRERMAKALGVSLARLTAVVVV